MTDEELFLTRHHGKAVEIQLRKSIEEDSIAPFDLRPAVELIVEKNDSSCVIVSLVQLNRCTTALINGLINLHKSLSQVDCDMKLCHVPPVIHQILNELQLEDVFDIYPSLGEALAAEQ